MDVIPSNGLQVLEFDKIIELLKTECTSVPAQLKCDLIRPDDDLHALENELSLVEEIAAILGKGLTLMPGAIDETEGIRQKLRKTGYVLDNAELATLLNLISVSEEIRALVTLPEIEVYPLFKAVVDGLPDMSGLYSTMSHVLDPDGAVRPGASPELLTLARQIQEKGHECNRVFDRVVRKYESNGWLVESQESVRNDRRVLAVKSEYKRKLRGIVHDQSATGKTAYVEPEELIELNNDLFELYAARRAEEYRVLSALCDDMRPFTDTFAEIEEQVVGLDIRHAKARMAIRMEASKPGLSDRMVLKLVEARHPLLLLKNNLADKETVPFTLELHKPNRLLLVSGPNAGGKSILMKSVGLIHVMAQSGFLVPVAEGSLVGLCRKICVEIGDQQSIENDLSTYSSRLLDMKTFIEVADENTLVLIDEFGSGTDPKLGGAIAEAILDTLVRSKCSGVLTTHYSELKAYAYKTKGVVNGAMVFNKDTMSPSYKLSIGKPGSSFAFEIASRTGMPQRILNYARNKAGRNTRALEELLTELEQKKLELEEGLKKLDAREKHADRLIANYEQLLSDLNTQRKRFKLEQKERDYFHLSQLNKEMEKVVRDARETGNIEKAKEQLKRVKKERNNARNEVSALNQDLAEQLVRRKKTNWQVGDNVRMRNSDQAGEIEKLDGKKATVIIGQIRITVPISQLVPAGEPVVVNPVRSVVRDVDSPVGAFNNLLDIRGLRPSEAESLVERFLDEALLANAAFVRIVHGKGTGALRKMVERKLREYPVNGIDQPEDQQGGSGVTIVQF